MKVVKYCLVCLRPADLFCGHVLKDNEKIIAGFCKIHGDYISRAHLIYYMNRKGCFGGWHEKYGLQWKEEDEE